MKESAAYRIKSELIRKGAGFVAFADISQIPATQNKNYPNAIVFGIGLSPIYLLKVSHAPDYGEQLKNKDLAREDEFNRLEIITDGMADEIAEFVRTMGYSAFSQSEKNLAASGMYNNTTKTSSLPHKTIAGLAGLGWIGKHNLLVTKEYGSAFSMCTVLTDAPLDTVLVNHVSSKCGACEICEKICQVNALKGTSWNMNTPRDELVDISLCNTCSRCMVLCPWTQRYMKRTIRESAT